VVVIDLIDLKVREAIGCDEREALRILRLIAGRQATLPRDRSTHGGVSMVELTTPQFEEATVRGQQRMRGPRAVSAHYDGGRNRIIVRMTTGGEIGFAPRDVEGLQDASADDLRAVEVEAFGLLGIHFPTIDADLYVPALLDKELDGRTAWRRRWTDPHGQGDDLTRER
jgi:hypothetical protein